MQKRNHLLKIWLLLLLSAYAGYASNNYIFDTNILCTARISELSFPKKDGTPAHVSGFIDLDMRNETIHFFLQSKTGDFINRVLQFESSHGVNGEIASAVITQKTISRSEYGTLGDEYHLFEVGTKHFVNLLPITKHVTQVNFGPINFFCENQERL